MEPKDFEEMARDLAEMRKRQKRQKMTAAVPTGSASSIFTVSMDFASLYPSTLTQLFSTKKTRRKKKIISIFI